MAKVISQETFDAVVKENMEEFEMSAEEAIEDATKQFEAQGINLANIVKDLCLITGMSGGDTGGKHPVVAAIESLTSAMAADPVQPEEIKSICSQIQSECDLDLAHRCLAGKNQAYPVLISACQKFRSNTELLQACVHTLIALCKGQPDLLDEASISLFLELLQAETDNTALAASLVKLIRLTCVQHEGNRQLCVKHDLIPILMTTLEAHQNHVGMVKEICCALRTLTLDDDIRVPFGKAHDHAKMIVTEADALRKILNISKDYAQDKAVLGELFATLSKLAVRDEFCQEIMDLGGLKLMLSTLNQNMDHQGITKQVLGVLKTIAGNDQVKVAIVDAGGMESILASMAKHAKNSNLCEIGCATIATVVLRNPEHSVRVMEANGAEVVAKAMQLHPQHCGVQTQGCMAVRNLVSRRRDYCDQFIELGAEALIHQASTLHTTCADEAKAALRDLGCKVELLERWKGEGRGIKA